MIQMIPKKSTPTPTAGTPGIMLRVPTLHVREVHETCGMLVGCAGAWKDAWASQEELTPLRGKHVHLGIHWRISDALRE